MKMSQPQIQALARSVGFTKSQAELVSAIAMGESGGDTNAINRNTNGSIDVGLMQINSIHGYSKNQMLNPASNMTAAYKISKRGTTFQPWVAYTNGSYRKFYKQGSSNSNTALLPNLPSIPGSPGDLPVPGIGGGLLDLADLPDLISAGAYIVKNIGDPGFWLRVGKVTAGGIVILIAINQILKILLDVSPGGRLVGTAKTAAEIAVTRKVPIK